MWDIENMDAALAYLRADTVEAQKAKDSLSAVGINWWATLFSPSVINYELTRHDPDYYRVTWGAMGKQINHFDMAPVWALIDAGQYDKAIARIQKMRDADALDLRNRVSGMIRTSAEVDSALRLLNRDCSEALVTHGRPTGWRGAGREAGPSLVTARGPARGPSPPPRPG